MGQHCDCIRYWRILLTVICTGFLFKYNIEVEGGLELLLKLKGSRNSTRASNLEVIENRRSRFEGMSLFSGIVTKTYANVLTTFCIF